MIPFTWSNVGAVLLNAWRRETGDCALRLAWHSTATCGLQTSQEMAGGDFNANLNARSNVPRYQTIARHSTLCNSVPLVAVFFLRCWKDMRGSDSPISRNSTGATNSKRYCVSPLEVNIVMDHMCFQPARLVLFLFLPNYQVIHDLSTFLES